MSDTPRTDAAHESVRFVEAPVFDFVPADFARELERENEALRASLEYVRSLGEVYVFPSDWDYGGQGGPPPIDAYEKIDLSDVGL